MKNVLILLSSIEKSREKYIKQILDNYSLNFKNYKLSIALSLPYAFSYPDLPIVSLPGLDSVSSYCWNNREYLIENYQKYDYVIDSDDDVLFTINNFEYYLRNQNLPLEYLPGFLTYENVGGATKLIHCLYSPEKAIKEKMTINNKTFLIPSNNHSEGFIIDRERLKLAIDKGFSIDSKKNANCITRDNCPKEELHKLFFKKAVGEEDVLTKDALIQHLPNSRVLHDFYQSILSVEQLFGEKPRQYGMIRLPRAPARQARTSPRMGLGDMVEKIAKPIAVALKMPCLDEEKRLKQGCGCAKRRDWLNQVGQKVGIGG